MSKYYTSIDQAIDKFKWNIQNGRWKANENDIKAFNALVEYVNNQRALNVNKNVPFAKLYIYVYSLFLKQFQASIFDPIPQKEISKLLDKPLSFFYEKFAEQINENERDRVLEKYGYDIKNVKHPRLQSEEDKKEKLEIWRKILKNETDKKLVTNPFKIEDVKDEMNYIISECINRFNES
ncbi:hypothetical protein [Galbibacter sp. BG1]